MKWKQQEDKRIEACLEAAKERERNVQTFARQEEQRINERTRDMRSDQEKWRKEKQEMDEQRAKLDERARRCKRTMQKLKEKQQEFKECVSIAVLFFLLPTF